MEQRKVIKVRENIKSGYKSKFGDLFIHGITLDDNIEYESHQKTQTSKVAAGSSIWYSITEDKQGNKKIKVEQAPLNAPSQSSAAASDPFFAQQAQSGAFANPTISRQEWLSVFNSLCALHSGRVTPVSPEDLVGEVSKILALIP